MHPLTFFARTRTPGSRSGEVSSDRTRDRHVFRQTDPNPPPMEPPQKSLRCRGPSLGCSLPIEKVFFANCHLSFLASRAEVVNFTQANV